MSQNASIRLFIVKARPHGSTLQLVRDIEATQTQVPEALLMPHHVIVGSHGTVVEVTQWASDMRTRWKG